MGERTQYPPGAFSWADVTTTDQSAAKDFYSSLFGWEAEDMPVDAGLAKVEELGGSKMAGPIDIGIAKIGIVRDPQGAAFAIYDGQFES